MRAKHARPEYEIQAGFIAYCRARGWLVERLIGNAFQTGIPDLYLYHPKWGQRWVDLKSPGRYSFTKAQRIKWPLWEKFGLGIWIVTSADQDGYDSLFRPPNWRDFVKRTWKIPTQEDIDKMLDEI